MQGRRIINIGDDGHACQPGDYFRGKDGVWYGRPPGCPNALASLAGHTVTEHDDGTITVSPSILISGAGDWHGFLERGVWREC